MSSIALIASGIASPLASTIRMAQKLRDAGHAITFLAPDTATHALKQAGFDHLTIPAPQITAFNALLPRPNTRRSRTLRNDRARQAVSAFGVDDLAAQLGDISPDLVIIDAEMHAHVIIALGRGDRVALATTMFLTPPGAAAPPLHYHQIPRQGWKGSKPAIIGAWAAYFARKSALVIRNALRDWGADHPTALTALAKREGVDLAGMRKFWMWQMPFGWSLPLLAMVPASLDLPVRPQRNLTFVGPMIHRDRSERPYDRQIIDAFCLAPDDPKTKRIVVAFGSMLRADMRLVRRLCAVIARSPHWRVLAMLRLPDGAQGGIDIPPNMTITDWAPQLEVLGSADLAVIHGGAASVMECVDASVPMLVYPVCNDQCGNAARVAVHGLGLVGRHGDDAKTIEDAMSDLLADDGIATRLGLARQAAMTELDGMTLENTAVSLISQGRPLA